LSFIIPLDPVPFCCSHPTAVTMLARSRDAASSLSATPVRLGSGLHPPSPLPHHLPNNYI
jgi:hypothetical protein